MNFEKEKIEFLKFLVSSANHIVITSHKSPDGDSVGSSLGLYHFLKLINKSVTICHPDKMPFFLKWLEGSNEVLNFESNKNQVEEAFEKADLIFCLDYNHPNRIGLLEDLLVKSSAKKVMVDHHQNPDENFVDLLFSNPNSCSTCQLIYEIINDLGYKNNINETIGTPIYCGIMTDTGSFRFPSTEAKTHIIIADLIDKGVKNYLVHEKVSDVNTIDKLKLIGYALSQKLELIENGQIAYIYLSNDEIKQFNIRKGDTEGLVNQALSIEGVKMGVFFKEEDGYVKISFRSKGNVYVNQLANDHFNGGGHIYAAGGKFEGTLEKAVEKFVTLANLYV